MKRRKDEVPQPFYVILNQQGEVFAGLKQGRPVYSSDWSEAKPLNISNTTMLKYLNQKIELIKEEEFI